MSPDPVIVERMLCQSQTMDFRWCAWSLLHSLLTKLITHTATHGPMSRSLLLTKLRPMSMSLLLTKLRLLRKHTHDLQLVVSLPASYMTLSLHTCGDLLGNGTLHNLWRCLCGFRNPIVVRFLIIALIRSYSSIAAW